MWKTGGARTLNQARRLSLDLASLTQRPADDRHRKQGVRRPLGYPSGHDKIVQGAYGHERTDGANW